MVGQAGVEVEQMMLRDHIEAMVKALPKRLPDDPVPDWYYPKIATEAWAAGVEALIAHKPCGGTNTVCPMGEAFSECSHPLVQMDACPGPHTVIVKGDGTKLYADWNKTGTASGIGAVMRNVPLPSEWRME